MAQSITDVVTVQYAAGGAPAETTTFSATGLGRAEYKGVIPDTTSSSGQAVSMPFLHANVVMVYLVSDQNLTINVNSDGSPDQAISLVAKIPVLVNPFTHDVTTLYLRNASVSTAANVTLLVLLNNSAS